jgi:hypothetical protein
MSQGKHWLGSVQYGDDARPADPQSIELGRRVWVFEFGLTPESQMWFALQGRQQILDREACEQCVTA